MVDLKNLKKGNYIVWENEACMVKDVQFQGREVKVEMHALFSKKDIEKIVKKESKNK